MSIAPENADLYEVLRAQREKRLVDPSVAKRIEERAAVVIEEIHSKGTTDIAVPLVCCILLRKRYLVRAFAVLLRSRTASVRPEIDRPLDVRSPWMSRIPAGSTHVARTAA